MKCNEPTPSVDEYWFGIATAAAAGSGCTRRKIGAVLVSRFNRVLGLAPNGLDGQGTCPRGALSYEQAPANSGYAETGCVAIHAEMKVLRQVSTGKFGSTMYVTCEPCPECQRVLNVFGIKWKFPQEG